MKATSDRSKSPPSPCCSCASSAPLIRDGRLVCAACGAEPRVGNAPSTAPGVTYSQREGQRPTGTGREKFLRVARALRAAGDLESWVEGRTVLVTAAAWARGLELLGQGRAVPKAPASEARPLDVDAEARELLGLAPRRTA